MATTGGPENSSWCIVVCILRGNQSRFFAVVSCSGVYIYYILVGCMPLIQLVLLRCVAIYRGIINTLIVFFVCTWEYTEDISILYNRCRICFAVI